ncbi:patatin-like phospholipase domain-containing protein 2 [Antennarius striatus]|uniref:patatin-like phospholipase domain-containing protein 2 n=1 Tax=Antennarius striatus TaxID=241820 RepID=UPI0035B3E275
MFDLKKEWSVSFAGCGYMGIYYVGASSCILERFPRLIQDASKVYGASAGAVMATVLTAGVPLDKCCVDLIFMVKEARKHKLGPLHPSYNLLQMLKDFLLMNLPEDAHVRASGKLCVSLTRVPDGKNVLVSEFNSREELSEVLLCSCFVPFYCGIIPPTYRGVHYVDGAISDNLPQCNLRNTVTISAYAGESDLCPRASTLNFHEVRFNNMSIQVNSENMYRVASTFFPPEPQAMAAICNNGYIDALRFLQENNLISSECPQRGLEVPSSSEQMRDPTEAEAHQWLDPQLIENLPDDLKKVLCEACRETNSASGLFSLPKKVTSYLWVPSIRPMESAYLIAQRLVNWIPDVPKDMSWLYGMAGNIHRQTLKGKVQNSHRVKPLRRCTSLPSGLNLWDQGNKDTNVFPMTPEATPTSSGTFTRNTNSVLDSISLTPPPTPTFSPTSGLDEATIESPQSTGGAWVLSRAVGWIRNIKSTQTENEK